MKCLAAAVLLLCGLLGVGLWAEEKTPAALSEIEQDVLEAVLEQSWLTSAHKSGILVMENILSLEGILGGKEPEKKVDSMRGQAKYYEKAFQEALEGLLAKNRKEVEFSLAKQRFPRVLLVNRAEVKGIFDEKQKEKPRGWDLFYKKYPLASGIISISKPGISPDGTAAIIYLGQQKHYLSGAGRLWLFKIQKGKWILQKGNIGFFWIS